MPVPGSYFTTIGGKIKNIVNGPTTERLLIIGTALDGPLNRPVQITSATDLARIFGPAVYTNSYLDPNSSTESGLDSGNSISQAAVQAIGAGCGDVWCIRATGTYATSASSFGSAMDIRALYPGRLYNSVSVTFATSGNQVTFHLNQPTVKGGAYITTYASSLNIGEMINQINGDRRNNSVYINPETYPSVITNACTTISSGTCTLSGGTNGTRAKGESYADCVSGYATMLTTTDSGTFDSILGQRFQFSVAVLAGIYIDDQVVADNATAKTTTTIASDFIYFLDQQSAEVRPCFGVMGTRPPNLREESSLITYITTALLATDGSSAYNSTLRWNKAGPMLNAGWKRNDPIAGVIDLGARLAVVAGPQVVYTHPELGRYSENWHVSYAAMLTTLPPERAPIYKEVAGITAYGTAYPAKYANRLVQGVGYDGVTDTSGNGAFVCLTRNLRDPFGPMVVFDDVTAAGRDEYFRNYQLVHLCNNIHSDVSYELSNFLGQSTGAGVLSAMETAVQNVLDGYTQSGALRGGKGIGYDYKVTMDGTDSILGIARVYMEIAPASALRRIFLTVAVRQSS